LRGLGRRLKPLGLPLLAILTAFLVGSIFILITDFENLGKLTTDPIGAFAGAIGNIANAYYSMLIGALGDPAATPLIFCGLGVAISFRSGVFNIGIEGQFVLGAFGASVMAIALKDQPAPLILVLSTLSGILTGALWGFIPGLLKAKTGASEVIVTIMLNYVAAQIVLFGLRSDFLRLEGSGQPISKVIAEFVRVPLILDLGQGAALRLHFGFVVALIMAVVVSWFLFKTTKGYELRAAGFNMSAARYAGMSASGSIILAMSLSGALAGLGGSMEVLGTVPQMSNDISSGFGFNAIALALLAGNRPAGIVAASILFGALRTGGGLMQVKTGIPLDLLVFIQALVIMFVAAPGLVRVLYRFDDTRVPWGRARDTSAEDRSAA
jgi:simple sugar transport system permease protein